MWWRSLIGEVMENALSICGRVSLRIDGSVSPSGNKAIDAPIRF
jgi:hypothetical protein